jgi:hypothetical protein
MLLLYSGNSTYSIGELLGLVRTDGRAGRFIIDEAQDDSTNVGQPSKKIGAESE